ncbi:MAG: hypothetical protein OIF50_07070 [Flavobacteriaceae bacterium]|nr:hypothetical protein [Flavobacteriaceae bacterium]
MRNIRYILLLVCFNLMAPLQAQIKKYSKIDRVEYNTYNFTEKGDCRKEQKKDKRLYIVFSDQDENNAYMDHLGLQQGKKQKFLTAYYVIDQERDFLELVRFDPENLGKPKGLFSYLYTGKYNFKKPNPDNYVGWIHKDNLLHYSHPILNKSNFRPLQYLLGFDNVRTLYGAHQLIKKDSVPIYTDPKFKKRAKKSLNINQFVYVYKFNPTGNAALISNIDNMHAQDSTQRVMGWVSTKLIQEVGQRQAYHVLEKQTVVLAEKDKNRPYKISGKDIDKQMIFRRENLCKTEATDSTAIAVISPLKIWNHQNNKLINVKGGDLFLREIPLIKKEINHINFHLVFDCDPKLRNKLKLQIASLQRIWLLIKEDERYKNYKFSFSASSFGCGYFYEYPKSYSFSSWIDYLQRVFNNDPGLRPKETNTEGIAKCFKSILSTSDFKSFENNIVLIAGENKLNLPLYDENGKPRIVNQNLVALLAQTSSRLLFYQLENKTSDAHQGYVLEAKKILNAVGTYYQDYIQNYMVENNMVKRTNVFLNLDDMGVNMFLYDAPEQSMYTGGIVFPTIGDKLLPNAFDVAMDSVMSKTIQSNKKLLSSLENNIDKLGFLRSKPADRMTKLVKRDQLYYKHVAILPKINKGEVFLETAYLNLFKNNSIVSGQLFTKNEINTLIEAYKSVIPLIINYATKSQRRELGLRYKKYIKEINKLLLYKELRNKNTLGDLLYVKGGIPIKNKTLNTFRIKDMHKTRKLSHEDYTALMKDLRNKIEALEYASNSANTIQFKDGGGTIYYFIPDAELF